jgi:hypothetical protein
LDTATLAATWISDREAYDLAGSSKHGMLACSWSCQLMNIGLLLPTVLVQQQPNITTQHCYVCMVSTRRAWTKLVWTSGAMTRMGSMSRAGTTAVMIQRALTLRALTKMVLIRTAMISWGTTR